MAAILSRPQCVNNISLGNGLLSIWCQAITWANAALLSIGPLDPQKQISLKFKSNIKHVFQENAFDSVIFKMSYILYRPQCIYSCMLQ